MNTTDNQDWIGTRPKEVRQGALLFYASIGVGIVGAVIDPNIKIVGALGIGLLLLIFAFSIFMINLISNGRNWARITMLVLFLIGSAPSLLFNLMEFKGNPLLGSLRIIIFIMQGVSLYLFFTESSNAWFNAQKGESQIE